MAAHKIIMSHVRLGMCIVKDFAFWHPERKDVYVAEMLYSLTVAVDRMSQGAIDHHEVPNVTGYLVTSLKGHLRHDGYKKGKLGIRVPLREIVDCKNYAEAKRTLELILSRVKSGTERKVIELRAEGRNDVEIGELLGCTSQWIGQIRKRIEKEIYGSRNGKDHRKEHGKLSRKTQLERMEGASAC